MLMWNSISQKRQEATGNGDYGYPGLHFLRNLTHLESVEVGTFCILSHESTLNVKAILCEEIEVVGTSKGEILMKCFAFLVPSNE
jgi:hypothetical protein